MDAKPTYVVSVYDKPHWRSLLSTKDEEAAKALYDSLVADGANARIEVFQPKKR
ncbi:hypothetical protein C8D77_11158 [Mesorhizobium loti]|uniref:Uncharacterized protein n=1 Tax=Rhizobium loti TaxID=381 RepID=A0A8E2W818_RHILI|nr:hypothetical protein [Mesorhizobium loti]PWJ88336.1 hypothetical protein C8D77_11158 [Mesorhizobium loti]